MRTIRAFIFDLDGVITDTAELHYQAWQQLAQEENLPFSREINDHLRGLSRRDSLLRILNARAVEEAVMETWMARKNDYYLALMEKMTAADILPGTADLLQEARAAGIKIALGSASKNARAVLQRLGLASLFDAVGDGYSVVNSKPAPDLFVWVAGRLDVSPAETVVFEDATAGVAAALAGGFYVVGIGSADVSRAHLTFPTMADVTVANVMDGLAARKTGG